MAEHHKLLVFVEDGTGILLKSKVFTSFFVVGQHSQILVNGNCQWSRDFAMVIFNGKCFATLPGGPGAGVHTGKWGAVRT